VIAGAVALKWAWGIERVRDILLNDETVYMASGVRMLVPGFPNDERGLPPASWSPVYACWYSIIHAIVRDPAQLYYVNWSALVFLTSIALFTLSRRLGATPLAALGASFMLVTSSYFEVWPYPTDFAVLVLLGGLVAALGAPDSRRAYRCQLIAVVFCVFVRPEFIILALALGAFYARAVVIARRGGSCVRPAQVAQDVVVVLAPALVLLTVFGNPLEGGRAFFAWGQHYALGQVERHSLNVDPWLNWWSFVVRDFGPVKTIGEALRANPAAFFGHLGHNLLKLPEAIADVLAPALALSPVARLVVILAYAAACVAGVAGLIGLGRRGARALEEQKVRVRLALVTLLAVAASTVPSIVVVRPRAHYLSPIVALGIAILAVGWGPALSPLTSRIRVSSMPRFLLGTSGAGLRMLAIAAVALAITPNRASGACVQTWLGLAKSPEPARRETLATIDALRNLRIRGRVVVLEQGYSYAFYAGLDFDRVLEWWKDRPFASYLREKNINLVVLSPDLERNQAFSGDAEYQAFAADPARFGFRVLPVPQTPTRIALRDDVVSAGLVDRSP
jgi:hypothetical protein